METTSAPIPSMNVIKCRFCKGDHWSAKCPHKDLLQDKMANEPAAKGSFIYIYIYNKVYIYIQSLYFVYISKKVKGPARLAQRMAEPTSRRRWDRALRRPRPPARSRTSWSPATTTLFAWATCPKRPPRPTFRSCSDRSVKWSGHSWPRTRTNRSREASPLSPSPTRTMLSEQSGASMTTAITISFLKLNGPSKNKHD